MPPFGFQFKALIQDRRAGWQLTSSSGVVLSAAKDLTAARHESASELLAMRSFAALRMT